MALVRDWTKPAVCNAGGKKCELPCQGMMAQKCAEPGRLSTSSYSPFGSPGLLSYQCCGCGGWCAFLSHRSHSPSEIGASTDGEPDNEGCRGAGRWRGRHRNSPHCSLAPHQAVPGERNRDRRGSRGESRERPAMTGVACPPPAGWGQS
jgi:hypothetical protein